MTQYYGESESPQRSYQGEDAPLAPAMRMGEWLITLILCAIPVVNVIMLFIWALEGSGNPNRKNFAVAMLILAGIEMVIFTISIGYFAGMLYQVFDALR